MGNVNEVKPLVSIVIPCYNGEDYVEEAINSVRQQTYNYWELIVIDDGSKDNTYGKLKKAERGEKIKVFRNKSNMGISYTRNKGIKRAKGQFISFLDQDDIYKKDYLKKTISQANYLESPGLIHTGLKKTDIENRRVKKIEKKGYDDVPDKNLAIDLFLGNKPFYSASTVTINAKCFEEMGLMNESLTRWDDQEMWIRILLNKSFQSACVEKPLVVKRKNNEQASSDSEVVEDLLRLNKIVTKKHPVLRKYSDRHISIVHFKSGVQSWRDEDEANHLMDVAYKFMKSIYYNPTDFKSYFYLLLSIGGRRAYIFKDRLKNVVRK